MSGDRDGVILIRGAVFSGYPNSEGIGTLIQSNGCRPSTAGYGSKTACASFAYPHGSLTGAGYGGSDPHMGLGVRHCAGVGRGADGKGADV